MIEWTRYGRVGRWWRTPRSTPVLVAVAVLAIAVLVVELVLWL